MRSEVVLCALASLSQLLGAVPWSDGLDVLEGYDEGIVLSSAAALAVSMSTENSSFSAPRDHACSLAVPSSNDQRSFGSRQGVPKDIQIDHPNSSRPSIDADNPRRNTGTSITMQGRNEPFLCKPTGIQPDPSCRPCSFPIPLQLSHQRSVRHLARTIRSSYPPSSEPENVTPSSG
jgi:hypothetical protein